MDRFADALTDVFFHADNEIVGEVLVALLHEDLKSMGITSVGHRLTILKSVYEVKKAQDVPFESDHYLPLCTSLISPSLTDMILTVESLQPPTPKPNMPPQPSKTLSTLLNNFAYEMNA